MAVEQSLEEQLNARKEKNRAEQRWSYQSKTAADLLSALGEKDVTKSDREASLISRASAAMREARELHRWARWICVRLYLNVAIHSPNPTSLILFGAGNATSLRRGRTWTSSCGASTLTWSGRRRRRGRAR